MKLKNLTMTFLNKYMLNEYRKTRFKDTQEIAELLWKIVYYIGKINDTSNKLS